MYECHIETGTETQHIHNNTTTYRQTRARQFKRANAHIILTVKQRTVRLQHCANPHTHTQRASHTSDVRDCIEVVERHPNPRAILRDLTHEGRCEYLVELRCGRAVSPSSCTV